ncbi:MAG: glycosyltransferase family 9 protein [Candidatus Absconditabacterales bacterium]
MNVKFLRFVDKYFFGFFILCFFRLKYFFVNKKKNIINHPKKILVIRLWALGSSLLTFPMIKQLENHFGNDVKYDLLASSRNIGIFKNQGYFNQTYNLFKIKDIIKLIFSFKKYDIVIDAEEYFKISSFVSLLVGKITIGYNNLWIRKLAYTDPIHYIPNEHNLINCISLLNPLGVKTYKPDFMEPLKYLEKDKIKVDNFLKNSSLVTRHSSLICLHTGGAETSKDRAWPQKKWIELITKILEKNQNVYIFLSGTKFEKNIIQNIIINLSEKYKKNVINICGFFNIFEFAYLLKKCNLMISNDTGPMHLAAAMGTKTIGLFGPELPSKFGPWPLDKNVGLYKGDGEASIKVHLALWGKCSEEMIDRIEVKEVMKYIDGL